MKTALLILVVLVAVVIPLAARAQGCIVPAPSVPPKAKQLVIDLPVDGGTIGCSGYATAPGARDSNRHAMGPVVCGNAVQFSNQALAIANGWNDGGVP